MIKAILFDLDGTLLPMDEEVFTNGYISILCKKLVPLGYDKEKLIQAIMAGTLKMKKNNGEKTNKQAFWSEFSKFFGKDSVEDEEIFKQFYKNEFKNSKVFCGKNADAIKVIDYVKGCGYKIILASNPLFPKEGMISRANFVGLDEKHFDYISTYENSCFSKPNPNYYLNLLKQNKLHSNEVIYIANSMQDDFIPAQSIGIKTFLVDEQGIKLNQIKQILDSIK